MSSLFSEPAGCIKLSVILGLKLIHKFYPEKRVKHPNIPAVIDGYIQNSPKPRVKRTRLGWVHPELCVRLFDKNMKKGGMHGMSFKSMTVPKLKGRKPDRNLKRKREGIVVGAHAAFNVRK